MRKAKEAVRRAVTFRQMEGDSGLRAYGKRRIGADGLWMDRHRLKGDTLETTTAARSLALAEATNAITSNMTALAEAVALAH